MPAVPGESRSDRAAATAAAAKRWPLSRIIGVALLILLLFSVAAIVAGGLALLGLHDNRERVVSTIDPAQLQVQRLDTALVDQETGVRGYALSGQKDFLAPYNQGVTDERNAIRALQAVIEQLPPSAAADLKSVTTAGPLLAHPLRRADHQPGRPDRKARGQPRRPDRQGGFRRAAGQGRRAAGRTSRPPGPRPWRP